MADDKEMGFGSFVGGLAGAALGYLGIARWTSGKKLTKEGIEKTAEEAAKKVEGLTKTVNEASEGEAKTAARKALTEAEKTIAENKEKIGKIAAEYEKAGFMKKPYLAFKSAGLPAKVALGAVLVGLTYAGAKMFERDAEQQSQAR